MSRYADIIASCKKDWNCDDLMDSADTKSISKIPFSSPLLNYSTYGGIPRAKMTEFFGEPSGGKSTTAVDICKNAHNMFAAEHQTKIAELQDKIASGNKIAAVELDDLIERGPKKVLYVDLEHSFDKAWANTLGVIPGTIDIMQPPDVFAEDLLQRIQKAIESGEVGLVVLDSIPSLVTQAEMEKKYGERTVAAPAGLLTTFCRKIIPILSRYDTTLIIINQTRDNMDNPYVVNTPGGKAIKFYSTLRILFKIGAPVDFLGNELPSNTDNPAGYIVTAKIVKQKSAPNDRRNGSYYLMAQSGISVAMDMAQLATKKYNIIQKSGAWFTLTDPTSGEVMSDENGKILKLNGFAKVLEYVQQHPDYYKKISDYIVADISGQDAALAGGDDSDGSYQNI